MVRIGRLDLRLRSPEEVENDKKKEAGAQQAAEGMHANGELSWTTRKELPDKTVVYGRFHIEVPEIRLGEVVLATVANPGFFDEYISRMYNRGRGTGRELERQAYEELLRRVNRREPLEDLFAGEKGFHRSLKKRAERRGIPPSEIESYAIDDFKGDLEQVIGGEDDPKSFMNEFAALIGSRRQTLPYKLRRVLFDTTKNSPDFMRLIKEKFGSDIEESVLSYVLENTNAPVFENLRLVTIDDEGVLTDRGYGREDVSFPLGQYLAVSGYFNNLHPDKPSKAEKEIESLKRRISKGSVREAELETGIQEFIGDVVSDRTYALSVRIEDSDEGRDYVPQRLDIARDSVATVFAVDKRFLKLVQKIAKGYDKKDAKVTLCKDFDFPYSQVADRTKR